MTEVVFVDTNILVYAHDLTAGEKHIRAVRALDRLWDEQAGRLSMQVLQECYLTVTQKLATASTQAREIVKTYVPWVQSPTTPETLLRASEISELAQISFWDALIVASAEQVEAALLYTEELNAGQIIAGVKIVNPLVTTEYDLPPETTPASEHEPAPPRHRSRRRG